MKKSIIVSIALSALVPALAFAQQVTNVSGLGALIINTINNVLVPVLFAFAFIVFLWGAFDTFILGANSEEVKERGKNLMLYGLIGFVVMVSIWGLVNLLTNSIGLPTSNPSLPTAPAQVH